MQSAVVQLDGMIERTRLEQVLLLAARCLIIALLALALEAALPLREAEGDLLPLLLALALPPLPPPPPPVVSQGGRRKSKRSKRSKRSKKTKRHSRK
jgi:hypothetical protein